MFIGGLHPDTTLSELRTTLYQLTSIQGLQIVKNKQGVSKGFAFFTVKPDCDLDQLTNSKIEVRGRTLQCESRCKKRSRRAPTRIFAGGIPSFFTNHLLQLLFENIGRVKTAYIVKGREYNQSRRFGYVKFFDQESVQIALQMAQIFYLPESFLDIRPYFTKKEMTKIFDNHQNTKISNSPLAHHSLRFFDGREHYSGLARMNEQSEPSRYQRMANIGYGDDKMIKVDKSLNGGDSIFNPQLLREFISPGNMGYQNRRPHERQQIQNGNRKVEGHQKNLRSQNLENTKKIIKKSRKGKLDERRSNYRLNSG